MTRSKRELGAEGGSGNSRMSKSSKSKSSKSKEHVSSKLKEMNGSVQQHLPESEFLCTISFKNTLPAVPSGPFFKQVDLSRRHEDFAEYHVSSLEKGYVWQPHFDQRVNIDLDLVDHDAVLKTQTIATEHDVEKEVTMYLSGVSGDRAGRSNAKKEHQANHWWLRDTLYFDNKLDRNRKFMPKEKNTENDEVLVDPCDEEMIKASFADAIEGDSKLEANVEWSVPILPSSSVEMEKLYSLARFEEDPIAGKKRKMDTSVISNIRLAKKGNGQSYAVSMLEKENEDDDSEVTGGFYKWVQDYRMDLKTNVDDQYAITVDEGSASYSMVGSQFNMGKLNVDEAMPYEAIVVMKE